ncbi:hypothetical protein JA1_005136 [Spathaspora sp. JA1]|nr:hypothetical protein JA1_005136 [Spathaspora sp. JA1]
MSIRHEELLEPNGKLIHLLPGNLEGLIKYESVYDIILELLDENPGVELDIDPSFLRNLLIEKKDTIDHSIVELTVDHDKSLMLSMLFGSTFIHGLDLVLNKYITFKSKVQLQDYLHNPLQHTSEFTIIEQTVSDRTIAKLLLKLGFKLQHGILMEVEQAPIDRANPIGEGYSIDLHNWYCNCNEYQLQYTNDMKPIEISQSITLIERFLNQSESVILDPIPLCQHILAILILLYNKDKLYSRVVQI